MAESHLGRRSALKLAAFAAAAPIAAAAQTAPGSSDDTADVVVIGGGLSGLTAARTLTRKGARVILLEARDRVGGRTYHGPIGTRRFDLGAQFVGPTQTRVKALAAEFGLTLKPVFTTGKRIWELRDDRLEFGQGNPPLPFGTLLDLPHVMGRVDALATEIGPIAPWSSPRAAELDSVTFASWAAAHSYTSNTADLIACSTRAVFGADPDEMSALFVAFYTAQADSLEMLTNTQGGAQDSIIVGGTQQLSLKLAEQLGPIVRLNQPVAAIRQDSQGVDITTEAGATIHAKHAIIAMPPGAAGRLHFDPPLSPERRQLQQRAPMGRYFKVIVTYDKPFWRDAGFSGEVASVRGPITASYDDDPGDGSAALLNFIGGDHALHWQALSPDQQKQAVLDCLARWFGPQAQNPTAYGFNPWANEPFTGGAPVAILAPGVLSRLGPALRTPCGRIHWAGTEAAEKWTGYMDGAIRAGEAAAVGVLAAG
jgi:monoamine oxidase